MFSSFAQAVLADQLQPLQQHKATSGVQILGVSPVPDAASAGRQAADLRDRPSYNADPRGLEANIIREVVDQINEDACKLRTVLASLALAHWPDCHIHMPKMTL